MARRKKTTFKLNPEWMFKEPIDFEYNKYTLLGYLKKCENNFEKLEIYPDFVELSLHLANLQSLIKENTLLLTQKKFEDCDDEILLKELVPKKPPKLDQESQLELEKTLKFSTEKVFDAFNLGKSIWNIVHDSIHISLKKNKENLELGLGFSFFYDKESNQLTIWEFEIKNHNILHNTKTFIKEIYSGDFQKNQLYNLIYENTSFKENTNLKNLPIFEVRCDQKFPLKESFIPIMRRKIMAYIFQIINFKKLQGIDSVK
jgi:hypothetical protein